MGKKNRTKNTKPSDQHVIDLIESRVAKRVGSCDWIKQHKMQQRTIKVEQIFQHFPALVSPPGNASVQPFFITANGFTYYDQSGLLVGEKTPQSAILDLSFKCFTYYEVTDIAIEFVPNRAQIAVDGDGKLISLYQQPTLANNIPQLNFVSALDPTLNVTDIEKYYQSLSARKGCQMLRGDKTVRLSMQLPSNLLQRQSEPMLRTSYSVASRQLYDAADLNYLVILPNIASQLARTPFGTFKYSMTIRLAGRVNPDSPQMQVSTLVNKVQDSEHVVVEHALEGGDQVEFQPQQLQQQILDVVKQIQHHR